MNQAIQFPDFQKWDAKHSQIVFPALQMGHKIICRVSREWLTTHTNTGTQTESELLAAFINIRFDVEEIAEQRIEAEDFAADGSVLISLDNDNGNN